MITQEHMLPMFGALIFERYTDSAARMLDCAAGGFTPATRESGEGSARESTTRDQIRRDRNSALEHFPER